MASGAKGKPQGPKIPYRLPEMLAAVHDKVFICEGEKDADTLTNLRYAATSASEGAGKWAPELNRWFEKKRVFVMEDNDEAGRKHAQQVAENLHGVASEVRIVRLPGLKEKGDVTDWLEEGNDPGRLLEICEAAPLYGKAPNGQDVEVPARLIKSSRDFVSGFVPPDYLVDGLLQRRFVLLLHRPHQRRGRPTLRCGWPICVDQGRPLSSPARREGAGARSRGREPGRCQDEVDRLGASTSGSTSRQAMSVSSQACSASRR